jgi:hypothetical protein
MAEGNTSTNPFSRYSDGGTSLLGIPAWRDGTARHGYGPPVFDQCGYPCAYCGYDMAAPYEAWLSLSVDHVVPQHLTKAGWPSEWLLDLINLVTCCRARNEFLNRYRVATTVSPASLSEFVDVRNRVYKEKLHQAQRRHAVERERYAAAREAGPVEAQEQLSEDAADADGATQAIQHVTPESTWSRTQRITANDISVGQIRVPHETKSILPAGRADVDVDLLGRRAMCRWDPRMGPDQERSGVIRIGRKLMAELAAENEALYVLKAPSGIAIRRRSTE